MRRWGQDLFKVPLLKGDLGGSGYVDRTTIRKIADRGLLIFDLGFFNFVWFDAFTDSGKFFVKGENERCSHLLSRAS